MKELAKSRGLTMSELVEEFVRLHAREIKDEDVIKTETSVSLSEDAYRTLVGRAEELEADVKTLLSLIAVKGIQEAVR